MLLDVNDTQLALPVVTDAAPPLTLRDPGRTCPALPVVPVAPARHPQRRRALVSLAAGCLAVCGALAFLPAGLDAVIAFWLVAGMFWAGYLMRSAEVAEWL
jgi:hypothetical protein